MLTCSDVLAQLDDYLDGTLDEAGFQELEHHLSECAPCRAEARGLRRLLSEASALPAELTPGRDLWPGIAARLEGRNLVAFEPRARRRAWLAPVLTLATAAVALLAVWLPNRPGAPAVASPGPATLQPAALPAGVPSGLDAAQADYERATQQLLLALQEQRAQLPEQTLTTLDQNLASIDRALSEIRAALGKDPQNAQLARLLNTTQRRRVAVLQRAVRLTRT